MSLSLIKPRYPSAALGIEADNATMVHLERNRGGDFSLRRAASVILPENLVHAAFDEPNISDPNRFAELLSEASLSAGLAKQEKWSVSLPEASTRAAILTLESATTSRTELEEILNWKYERTFGAPHEELRVSREKLQPDPQGKPRYLLVAVRLSVLEEYESVFSALGWRAGLILPRHQGEGLWITRPNGGGDSLLLSSHVDGFTALLLHDGKPAIVRSVMCDAEDRDDELFRLLLFYRDRVIAPDDAAGSRLLERLLVVGKGFDRQRVSDIVRETLETNPRLLESSDVGLALPSGELSFDAIAAPAGLATLAW